MQSSITQLSSRLEATSHASSFALRFLVKARVPEFDQETGFSLAAHH